MKLYDMIREYFEHMHDVKGKVTGRPITYYPTSRVGGPKKKVKK